MKLVRIKNLTKQIILNVSTEIKNIKRNIK